MKILIVVDEARMAELLRKGLTEEGHTVVCGTKSFIGQPLHKTFAAT